MLPPALVLQHAAPETPGLIADALAERGVGLRTVRVDTGEPAPREVGDASALVVMGGPMGVYEEARYPHLAAETRLIEGALAAGVPILGVCLGSQLLAHVLGSEVRPGPGPEIGWLPVTRLAGATGDPLFNHVPARFTPLHWHGDVFDLPSGAVPLLRSDATPLQAFRYDSSASVYGLLCHLEVSPTIVNDMVRTFADEARAAGIAPEQILAEVERRLPALQATAQGVFARWASLVVGEEPYVPIACGFHDRLESHAVLGNVVPVEVQADGGVHTVRARITDVFARGEGEYARLLPGDGRDSFEVRLDRIVSISGTPRPGAC